MFAALERINFQINSKLSTRIVELCQETIDYGDTLAPGSSIIGVNDAALGKMKKHLTNVFAPSLANIVKEELNLNLRKIIIHKNDYACYMIPIFHFLPNTRSGYISQMDTTDTFSGTKASEQRSSYKLEDYMSLKDTVDLTIGKIKGKVPYSIDLGLSCIFFLSSKLYTTEYEKNNAVFTANEIAALILHELGHGMTILEHTADNYYRADMLSQTVKDLKEKTTEEKLKIAQIYMKSPYIDAKGKKILTNMNTKIAALLKENDNTSQKRNMIGMLVNVFIYSLIYMISLASATIVNGNTKSSDTMVSIRNHAFVERIADEFVARHGLGGELASGLNKYGYLLNAGYATSISRDKAFSEMSMFMTIFAKLMAIQNFFNYPIQYIISEYDMTTTRIKEMVLATSVALKDQDIPDVTRKELLRQIDIAENIIKDIKSGHRGSIWFWDVFLKISNYRNLPMAVANANLAADYAQLEKITDGFIRNPLYITAARIKDFY